jgi:hypothetical protein
LTLVLMVGCRLVVAAVDVQGATSGVPSGDFADLQGYEWAAEAIDALASQRIIGGVSQNRFGPAGKVTRAEFAVLMQRVFRLPYPAQPRTFPDVRPGFWAYRAVEAAAPYMNQITCPACHLPPTFGPDESMRREGAAVFVVRVLVATQNVRLVDDSQVEAVLQNVPGADRISGFVGSYVATAITAKVMRGNPNGTFDPMGSLTRAQVAVIFYRVQQMFGGPSGLERPKRVTVADANTTISVSPGDLLELMLGGTPSQWEVTIDDPNIVSPWLGAASALLPRGMQGYLRREKSGQSQTDSVRAMSNPRTHRT